MPAKSEPRAGKFVLRFLREASNVYNLRTGMVHTAKMYRKVAEKFSVYFKIKSA